MSKESILKELRDYVEKNSLTTMETVRFMEELETEVLLQFVDDKDGLHVLKRNGLIESFDKTKYYYSIANASDDAKMPMTQSSIDSVVKQVRENVRGLGRNLIRPIELRTFTIHALHQLGYDKVKDVYIEQTEKR